VACCNSSHGDGHLVLRLPSDQARSRFTLSAIMSGDQTK
jgi:hypothetical protein